MKSLEQEVSLEGRIEEITMMEFRSSPGRVLDAVTLGKVFLIKRAGKVLGVLSKPPGVNLSIVVLSDGKHTYQL